jgi:hypothetical protein
VKQAQTSAFLHLPIDLVLLISDSFLDPVSVRTLSLTCKDLSNVIGTNSLPVLEDVDRKAFLLLLEKDPTIGRPLYYCHCCVRLHYVGRTFQDLNMCGYVRPVHCRAADLRLGGTGPYIRYTHARLVMNQHFYGAPCGLPLSTFNKTYCFTNKQLLRWEQVWSARVIDDKLFLSAIRFEGTRAALCVLLHQQEYRICRHLKATELSLACPHSSDSKGLRQCCDRVGACDLCTTDYTTTVEKKMEYGREEWIVSINAFHDLGSCRSPSDPKWVAFHWRWDPSRWKLGLLPGEVRNKWQECLKAEASLAIAACKSS